MKFITGDKAEIEVKLSFDHNYATAGTVTVIATDANGKSFPIVTINPDGSVCRWSISADTVAKHKLRVGKDNRLFDVWGQNQ